MLKFTYVTHPVKNTGEHNEHDGHEEEYNTKCKKIIGRTVGKIKFAFNRAGLISKPACKKY